MTKTSSTGKPQKYNFNANENFVMFLTLKLITCLIDDFTFGMKSQSIAYSHSEMHMYVGFWILKVERTQYESSGQATFKNAKAMPFPKLDGADNSFRPGSKKSRISFFF